MGAANKTGTLQLSNRAVLISMSGWVNLEKYSADLQLRLVAQMISVLEYIS
jgi:hypothetical protein